MAISVFPVGVFEKHIWIINYNLQLFVRVEFTATKPEKACVLMFSHTPVQVRSFGTEKNIYQSALIGQCIFTYIISTLKITK